MLTELSAHPVDGGPSARKRRRHGVNRYRDQCALVFGGYAPVHRFQMLAFQEIVQPAKGVAASADAIVQGVVAGGFAIDAEHPAFGSQVNVLLAIRRRAGRLSGLRCQRRRLGAFHGDGAAADADILLVVGVGDVVIVAGVAVSAEAALGVGIAVAGPVVAEGLVLAGAGVVGGIQPVQGVDPDVIWLFRVIIESSPEPLTPSPVIHPADDLVDLMQRPLGLPLGNLYLNELWTNHVKTIIGIPAPLELEWMRPQRQLVACYKNSASLMAPPSARNIPSTSRIWSARRSSDRLRRRARPRRYPEVSWLNSCIFGIKGCVFDKAGHDDGGASVRCRSSDRHSFPLVRYAKASAVHRPYNQRTERYEALAALAFAPLVTLK